ncbi:hypothetical protein M422DRAFT_252187 [Sphaerobolus stellatus SS14]|uniref:Uncharacterized protein n=1 Tax=Sphaerobolus stellatus (strain SS14) TaxID=990650 RepID=A0A0C9VC71_SPHS4|nr:hypothetical protein M422DRAFT_252187 [Sphaerobolus stellatus SS14]
MGRAYVVENVKAAKVKAAKVKVAKVKVAKVDVKTAEDKDQAHGESEYEDEEEEANVQVDDKSDDKVEDEEQLGDKHEQERDDGHEQDIEQEQFLEEENEPDDIEQEQFLEEEKDDDQEQDDGHEQDNEHEQHLGEEHELDDEVEQDKEHADDHHGPQTRCTLVLLKDQTKKLRTIVKLLQKTPGYMKYNDHGKLLFDTELQQHLDAMILCMYKNVTKQFPACAEDRHSRLPTILSLSQKTGSTAKTFPLTANHVINGKTYEQGDPSSQSDASTGIQPHNIFLPGDKSVCRTTLDDTSAFEQQHISGKKFNSYSRADLQESNGSLHNVTLQDSVSTMDPTAAASFKKCGTNSHVAPMMPNNRGSGGVMPGAVTSSHKGLKRTLSQSSIESLGSSNTHQRQHNTYKSNSDDQPDLGSQCSTISSRKRPK